MKYFFSTLILFSSLLSFAQQVEWQPLTREIKVDLKDSIIKARIMINPAELKVVDEYIYYWHSKGQINKNMGGYSGDILHGEIFVVNKNKRMITQGQFIMGLKSGIWKRWYENGNLRAVENWKNGYLEGSLKKYEEDGKLSEIIEYRHGQPFIKEEKSFKIFMSGRTKPDSDSIPANSK